jgi:putative DNA primase/helicase
MAEIKSPGAGSAHGASDRVSADASDNTANSVLEQEKQVLASGMDQPTKAKTGSNTTAIIVSAVRYEAPVGKPYGFEDGEVTKPDDNFRSKKAVGETFPFNSFEDFATWRKELTTENMLTSGTFENVGEIPVVYKDKEKTGEASASKKFLDHRERPGILIIDIDFKDTDEVAGLYLGGDQPHQTHEAALSALSKVLPEADGSALLIGWSTSSNFFNGEEQVKGTGGIRIYLPITDASKIPAILEIMHKRSWLHGEGWAFVDKAGQFQERSLVDQALKAVTQPDYAAPDLRDGLTQEREWGEYEGDYLNPEIVMPLSQEEEEQYREAVAAAKNKLESEMADQRKIWLAKNAREHEKKGLNTKRAMSVAIQLLDNGVLLPTGSVFFDDGTEVPVLDLLIDGATHDGKTCKDPVEPDYNGGASVGQYYWNDGLRPGIHSFAHGPKWYSFKFDAACLKNLIESADREAIVRGFAMCELSDEIEYAQLETDAAKALNLGTAREPLRKAISKLKGQMADAAPDPGVSYNGADMILEPDKPTVIANKFIKTRYTDGSTRTLVEQYEDFYKYTGTHYSEILLSAVRSDLYDFLEKAKKRSGTGAVPFNPKMKAVTEVMDAVKAKTHIPSSAISPFWSDGREGPAPEDILVVRNGLLQMSAWELHPHDAAFFSLDSLTYDYEPDAPEPVLFKKFLNDLFKGDPDGEALLQEMFGYILSGNSSLQKILMIIGPKRSGKGTLGRVLVALVGAANTCSPRLESLGSRFGLQPLIGKKFAYMSDVRLEGLAKQQTIAENILRISGEDDVNVERKIKTDWFGRLPSRFLMVSNMVPRIADASGALSGRFVMLVLKNSFFGREDPELTDKLLAELPGILLWALDGWSRLQEQGSFTVPKSSAAAIASLERLTSPVLAFLDDECELGDGNEIPVDTLFLYWKSWCEAENRNYPGTKETFCRDVHAAVSHVSKVRKRSGDTRSYYYRGIGLKKRGMILMTTPLKLMPLSQK